MYLWAQLITRWVLCLHNLLSFTASQSLSEDATTEKHQILRCRVAQNQQKSSRQSHSTYSSSRSTDQDEYHRQAVN